MGRDRINLQKIQPGLETVEKQTAVFPASPQPLLLLINQDKKQSTKDKRRSFTQNP